MELCIKNKIDNIAVIGDSHENFKGILYYSNSFYKLENSLVFAAGDFGVGRFTESHYINIFYHYNKELIKNNNTVIVIRGNHDDPLYFNNGNLNHSNIILVPDYTVVTVGNINILLVGGAISVDRVQRLRKGNTYWFDEAFVYDEEKLDKINKKITHVITHSAPNFCFPDKKDGIMHWLLNDEGLLYDINKERADHTKLYEYLIKNGHPIKEWFYGHFHGSKVEYINDIKYTMLNILELKILKDE